jgi:5'-nucleotidase
VARVMITNDDGIDSEGLHRLAEAAVAAGHDVFVAAPIKEASGASAGLTAVEGGDGIVVEERELPGLEGVPAFAVAATPAFIVLMATRGTFGDKPEIVLSGINRGANTGRAVLHSGTVGAALTAVANGCLGMAVSLDVGLKPGPELHWQAAATVAGQMLPQVVSNDFVLNINVPNRPLSTLAGIRRAKFAKFGVVQITVQEQDKGLVKMSLEEHQVDPEPDTDEALLLEGYVTVSPVRPPAVASDVELDELPDLVAYQTGG